MSVKTKKALPQANGDFYALGTTISEEDQTLLRRTRDFLEAEVAPVINEYWVRAEFPHHLVPRLAELHIMGLPYHGYGCPGKSTLLDGMMMMELARVDSSIATFRGVHSGLAMGSIYLCGSDEQKQRWLPPMARLEQIGSFGLTEPEVGSGTARGLTTTARRDGDTWVLNGQKKWIGNATFADVNIIWARDVADDQVKGFVVEKGTPGFKTEKLQDKIALRVVQNAHIALEDCRVPETNRLQEAQSFRDVAAVLRMTRAGVAWEAVGCTQGAYEFALTYAQEREQFGRPIGAFQLVQDLLVRMLGNITACQCLVTRLSHMQDAGMMADEHASLAKAYCTVKMRESVGHARELLGGNGILLDHQVEPTTMRNGWFHTGDLARRDEDGYLSIVDRAKDMIIRGGFNVYPREIEEVLMTHPAVSLAAVIGVSHDRHGEEVKAFVLLKEGASITEVELMVWSKQNLADYKYPRLIEFRAELPMSATGKF